MNNYQNIWRIEHISLNKGLIVNVGLYQFVSSLPKNNELYNIVLSWEPQNENAQRKKYAFIKRNTHKDIPLPASFNLNNPGGYEDPGLRDVLMKEVAPFFYGFRTLQDANKWIREDYKAKKIMDSLGLCLRKYRNKRVIHGLKQSIADLRKETVKTNSVIRLLDLF